MGSVVLDSSEFALLLGAVNATSVVGVDDPALFPPDQQSRDATYTAGLQLMKEHGWIKPADQPSQFHFDSTLYLMVAVVANPEFVVFTIRDTEDSGRLAIIHYLAGPDIVELVATADGKYHLGVVPDRSTLLQRIKSALGLQDAGQQLRTQFFTEEETFEKIKQLCKEGQREQATAVLERLGLDRLNVDSLLVALGAPETSEVLVVKTEQGQVKAGRRAWLLRGADVVWLAKRVDATSTTISVEAVQADALPRLLDSFIQFLSRWSDTVRCPSCGTTNPPGSRFCNQCGNPYTPQESPPSVS